MRIHQVCVGFPGIIVGNEAAVGETFT